MNAVHDVEVDLSRIDLNLLVAFDALARERSVTLAAQRVGVTQSALSHALKRLRTWLGDPLFVRGRSGMVLTPRAEALVVPVRASLVALERALAQPAKFDPALARRAFALVTPDLFDVLVVPQLLEHVRAVAPYVDLTLVPSDLRRLPSQLETGEVDVAVVPQVDEVRMEQPDLSATGFVRRTLFRDQHVCFVRADHPWLRAHRSRKQAPELTLDAYTELSHVVVSPQGAGPGIVDQMLAKKGRTRRVALRIPHFYSALGILAKCDLVLTAPRALAQVAPQGSVVQLEPPLRLPKHAVHLVWHERFTKDPGHLWLREAVSAVSAPLLAP